MKSNRLKFNPFKSEFIWCATTRRLHLADMTPFHFDDSDVTAALSIRNLDACFNANMDMKTHIKQLVQTSFYQRRRIREIRRSIPTSTAIRLANSFVISKIDYCNSLLAGLLAYQLEKIQSILNYAACLIYGRRKYDHVTPLLRDDLHLLRIPQRVRYKSCLLVYKAYHCLTSPVTVAVYPVFKADLRSALRLTINLSFQGRKPSLVNDPSLWLAHRIGTIYRTLLRHQHLSSNSNRG